MFTILHYLYDFFFIFRAGIWSRDKSKRPTSFIIVIDESLYSSFI